MKARDIMKTGVATCPATANLSDAVQLMWQSDCGLVPIVEDGKRVVGVVTDRDAVMASWTQGKALQEIPVTVPMSRRLSACRPGDELRTICQTMQQNRVKRLLVLEDDGRLEGVVSLACVARAAMRPRTAERTRALVAETLAAFSERAAAAAV